jgi:hypothetical protein
MSKRRTIMLKTVVAGFIAATAMLATPAMAGMEATQEPGVVGFNYPDSNYLTGGYGHRFSPGPRFYFRHGGVGPGALVDPPFAAYGYYGGPVVVPWYGR